MNVYQATIVYDGLSNRHDKQLPPDIDFDLVKEKLFREYDDLSYDQKEELAYLSIKTYKNGIETYIRKYQPETHLVEVESKQL